MAERVRKTLMVLAVLALVFWAGYKTGEVLARMKTVIVERIAPAPKRFFIVEKYSYGSYSHVSFDEVGEDHPVVKFFFNEKLRPLLKLRDIKIYTDKGENIY